MIVQDYVEHALGALCAIIMGVGGWVWRTSTGLNKALIELGIARSDISSLKTDTRQLQDQSVRQDTHIQGIMTQLVKLDRIETISANTEVIKSTVTRLDQQVIPREALEARFRAIEDRLP